MEEMDDLANLFSQKILEKYPRGIEWGIVGILTNRGDVYTLSFDSKILSGVFEIFCEPIIRSIADDLGYCVEKTVQNAYPDFTLYRTTSPERKHAIEVKSTYRQFDKQERLKKFSFTLGSYRSFLRDPYGRKGILYPYADYVKHWVIGFIYSRNPNCRRTEIRPVIDAARLQSPYTDIEFFVQEKFRIAGRKPGSGNTTNIGSIKSDSLDDFRLGKGTFQSQEEFEQYWRSY